MRKLLVVVVGLVASGLAACSPGVAPATEAPSMAPSPTVTTPQWTTEEQAAVDAVNAYLKMWASIGQNITGDTTMEDMGQMYAVATDPAAIRMIGFFRTWKERGQHLVGTPSFEPSYVRIGSSDSLGERYEVHGCYLAQGSHLEDAQGTPVEGGAGTSGPNRFLVLHRTIGTYFVVEDVQEEGTC